jgi:hypothetical protein
VAVLAVHGGEVLREGVPAEGLGGAQGGVRVHAQGGVVAAAAAGPSMSTKRSRNSSLFLAATVQVLHFAVSGLHAK